MEHTNYREHNDGDSCKWFHFVTSVSSDFLVLGIDIFARQGDAVILRLFLLCDKQVVFRLQKVGAIVNGDLEIVAMRDRVFRTSLDAKSAEDAAAVVDVVNLRIALVTADSFFIRTRIGFGLNIDAVGRTRSGAKVTRDAFLLSVFVNVKQMLTAVARLNRDRHIRILHGPFFSRDLRDGPLHSLDDRYGRLKYVSDQ